MLPKNREALPKHSCTDPFDDTATDGTDHLATGLDAGVLHHLDAGSPALFTARSKVLRENLSDLVLKLGADTFG
jgi:hypothetical protein